MWGTTKDKTYTVWTLFCGTNGYQSWYLRYLNGEQLAQIWTWPGTNFKWMIFAPDGSRSRYHRGESASFEEADRRIQDALYNDGFTQINPKLLSML